MKRLESRLALMAFLSLGWLAGGLLYTSPMGVRYERWEESGEFAKAFLEELDKVVDTLPAGSILEIHDMPAAAERRQDEFPRVREISYLCGYSIGSWLRLTHPGKAVSVDLKSVREDCPWPGRVSLEVTEEDGGRVVVLAVSRRGI